MMNPKNSLLIVEKNQNRNNIIGYCTDKRKSHLICNMLTALNDGANYYTKKYEKEGRVSLTSLQDFTEMKTDEILNYIVYGD